MYKKEKKLGRLYNKIVVLNTHTHTYTYILVMVNVLIS